MPAPGLWSYYTAATAARMGDEMVAVAVVLLVLDRTGRPQLAGAVVAAYLLPALLSGPLLGAWLDRTRYRRAALAANQGLLGLAMLALLATVGEAPAWTALACSATVGLTVPMTSGGFTSLLPRLVPSERLGRAHALEGASFNAAAILGPAIAATLAATVSAEAAVVAIVGATLVSLSALPGINLGAAPARRSMRDQPGLLAAMRTGVAHLAGTAPLRGPTVATSAAFVGVGMLTVALPLHAEDLTGDAALAGFMWMAIEAGAMVAAFGWGRWHARWRPERVVLLCLVGSGVAMLTWPLATGFGVLLGLALVAGLAGGAGLPALFAARQRYTPPQLLGQISTTGASLKLAAFAAGAALGGQLVPRLGAITTLALVAAIQLLGAALGTITGRPRRPLELPDQPAGTAAGRRAVTGCGGPIRRAASRPPS
jgi:MFS family permease